MCDSAKKIAAEKRKHGIVYSWPHDSVDREVVVKEIARMKSYARAVHSRHGGERIAWDWIEDGSDRFGLRVSFHGHTEMAAVKLIDARILRALERSLSVGPWSVVE